MEKSDFVIIGGVAAGPKTAAVLARRKPNAKITLFQMEERISYATCGMPYFASGDIDSFDMLTETSYNVNRDPEFFKSTKGFDVVISSEVIKIDRDNRTVKVLDLKTGQTFDHGYGKLVIATGAKPNNPPFEVAESPNIRHFTKPEDAIAFRKSAQTGQVGKAVVVGAGFIGCELAESCAGLWGIETTLIEKENQVLPYALDPEMAAIAEREMKRNDVKVMTGVAVEKIKLNDDGNPVVMIRGSESIEADFVFLCVGVTPRSELARGAGLEIGEQGGIRVNDHMQTSDPNIYAGGDCVQSHNMITGGPMYLPMGSIANRHGRVIGENLAGYDAVFQGVVGSFLVKIFDLNVGSTGLSQRLCEKLGLKSETVWGSFPDKPDYYPEYQTMTLKMVYSPNNGKLLGLQAAGKGDIFRRVDVFAAYLMHGERLGDLLDFEQGYAPPYSEAIDPLHHLACLAIAQGRGLHLLPPVAPSEEDAQYIDVREPAETREEPFFSENGLSVRNIPLGELRARLGELDRNRKVIIICRRGPRSYQAGLILKQAGFEHVEVMCGGTQALR